MKEVNGTAAALENKTKQVLVLKGMMIYDAISYSTHYEILWCR